MSRLVNRIMDDEIYRDCWEFCKRVMEDGTCREVASLRRAGIIDKEEP